MSTASLPATAPPTHPDTEPTPGQGGPSALGMPASGSVLPVLAAVDWSPFGSVVPVMAGSSGAGASVFAAATAHALQWAGRCALLIDTAEPSRSGLCSATEVDGQHATRPVAGVLARYSWMGHAVLARREPDPEPGPGRHNPIDLAGLGSLPALQPHQWLPLPPLEPLHTTVVDLGGDWARPHSSGGHPLTHGALAWLRAPRAGTAPRPVLVVRATRPSLAAAEAALARLDIYVGAGELVAPARLVVMASWKKRGWPRGVTGAAGARVGRLLEDAVFLPYDRDLDLGGITAARCPERIRSAVAELLDEWDLLPPHTT